MSRNRWFGQVKRTAESKIYKEDGGIKSEIHDRVLWRDKDTVKVVNTQTQE